MKKIILFLCLMSFAPFVIHAQKYKHKSEAEIAAMTPAQRVDEYANEQAFHKYDVLDEQSQLFEKYIWNDGTKALPRIIEIINEYDPTRASGKSRHKGERFDGAWMLLGDIDTRIIRLRSTAEGKRAMDALERSIQRMRDAGYGQPDQHDWERHGRFDLVAAQLKNAKGVNSTDENVRDTLRLEYKVRLSDTDLRMLSDFLTAHYPDYPGWSKTVFFHDFTRFNYVGNPLWTYTMRKPERFYEVYLEFEKSNQKSETSL